MVLTWQSQFHLPIGCMSAPIVKKKHSSCGTHQSCSDQQCVHDYTRKSAWITAVQFTISRFLFFFFSSCILSFATRTQTLRNYVFSTMLTCGKREKHGTSVLCYPSTRNIVKGYGDPVAVERKEPRRSLTAPCHTALRLGDLLGTRARCGDVTSRKRRSTGALYLYTLSRKFPAVLREVPKRTGATRPRQGDVYCIC